MFRELYKIKEEAEQLIYKDRKSKDVFLNRIKGAIAYTHRYKSRTPYSEKILANIKDELLKVKGDSHNDK